jgi:hypothetical protein
MDRGGVGAASTRLSEREWLSVVAAFVALSALDLALTLGLVDRGAVEMNPFMAGMLAQGWGWTAAFKGAITLGVAVGLWLGRRHRQVRRAGIGFVVLLAAVVLYQLIDLSVAVR